MEAGTSMTPEPERGSSSLDIGLIDFQILGALGYGGSSDDGYGHGGCPGCPGCNWGRGGGGRGYNMYSDSD